jgi:hypothetical protein
MEKLLYPLWRAQDKSPDDFRDTLLQQLCPQLLEQGGVRGIRLCVADSAVAAAAGRRMINNAPVPDAMLSLWVDAAGAAAAWEPLIDASVARRSAYQVVESEPLVNQATHPSQPGERVYGMCHVVFFRKPQALARDQWLEVWQGSHTRVAIDTQSTFGYRQNVVVRTLDEHSLAFDAIVEENFPPGAMTSDHDFYDTDGDDEQLQQRMTEMMNSCVRFIDFESIDVIPMSEYLVKPLS